MRNYLTVLDVGPAVPETISFFNRISCRVYVLDLIGSRNQPLNGHQTWLGDFAHLSDIIPTDEHFDICLFWDYFNYIDDEKLIEFGEILSTHISMSTRAHAFVAFNMGKPIRQQQYGINEVNEVVLKVLGDEPVPYPRTRSDIVHFLPQLEVQRAMLLTENRQEIFLMGARA